MTSIDNQDPMVRSFYVCMALQTCESNIARLIQQGRLPRPDLPRRQWRLSTIRAANPALADSIEILLKIPRTAVA